MYESLAGFLRAAGSELVASAKDNMHGNEVPSIAQRFRPGWFMLQVIVHVCVAYGSCLAAIPENTVAWSRINRLYVFGDSYSDTGAGHVDGDGPTAVAYLAERLGITLLPSNTSNPEGKGLNFAVSGAQTGSGSGQRIKGALLGLGMRNQVEDFVQRVRTGAIRFQPGSTLFFFAGGLNDGHLATGTTVENLKTEIRILHAVGARRFMIALLPTSIPGFSEVGKRLNPALARIPPEMTAELQDSAISLSYWGSFFDDIMRNPLKYGITDTTDACAGRAIFNQDPKPCSKPASYFYYHAEHPSTAVHKIVGEKLYEEVLRLPPPSSIENTKMGK